MIWSFAPWLSTGTMQSARIGAAMGHRAVEIVGRRRQKGTIDGLVGRGQARAVSGFSPEIPSGSPGRVPAPGLRGPDAGSRSPMGREDESPLLQLGVIEEQHVVDPGRPVEAVADPEDVGL